MMFQNKNAAVVNTLALRIIRTNRMRNLVAVLTIALTTLLITALFTVGMSMLKSLEYSTARQVGSIAHGSFKHISPQQFETLHKHPAIKEYGVNAFFSIATNPELAKRQVQLQYMDDTNARFSFVTPLIAGTMPNADSEIVLDTITLDLLGLKHELGQRITMYYEIDGNTKSSEFTLSGYYQGDKLSMASLACVTQQFMNKALAGDISLLNLDVMISNAINIKGQLIKIIVDSGLSPNDIDVGVNWAYAGSDILSNPKDALGVLGLLLLIMVCGYLMIYNIFNIAVVKETRFYGLLKTVGTTPRQIKKLLVRQATALCAVGITLGLAAGYLAGAALTPVVLNATNIAYTARSFSLTIFLGAAVFAYLTVLISIHKPARKAGQVSPIEAIRRSGVESNGRNVIKSTVHGARIHRMAFTNLLRNKSRVGISILSLSLSLVLFNTVYTMATGFELNKFLSNVLGADLSVADVSFYRWRFFSTSANALTPELFYEISNLNGITSADRVYYHLSLPDGKNTALEIYGVDLGLLSLLEKHLVNGQINKELFARGEHVILKGGNLKPGDRISLQSSTEYTVMAVVDDLPLYLYSGRTIPLGTSVYIPSQEFFHLTDAPALMTALFNTDANALPYIERYIEQLVVQYPTLDYRSRATYEHEYQAMVNAFNVAGYALSFILALIGLLNFANVITTSILMRRHEFAAMQSIGMTTSQLKQLLAFEGLYYTLLTAVSALVLGAPIAHFGIRALTEQMPYFTYRFSVFPILLSLPALATIAVIIPLVGYASTCKASVVARLREIE